MPSTPRTTIDPSRSLNRQRIGSSFSIPYAWIPVVKARAYEEHTTYSELICAAVQEYFDARELELPDCSRWGVIERKFTAKS